MYRSLIVLTISLLIFYVKSQTEGEGETCILEKTGESGLCKAIFDCPGTIEGIRRRIIPQPCGYLGYLHNDTPAVCCARPQRKVGDISKKKCQDYHQYTFKEPAVSLGLFHTVPQYECALGEVENIIKGTLAKPKEFPHMALLGFESNKGILWLCGGSLISNKFVLTASHCLGSFNYGNVKYVRLGDLDIDSTRDDAEPQEFTVKNIFLPPNFTLTTKHRDIGLIELDHKAYLNPYVRPACLNLKETLTNRLAIASGWGHTTDGGRPSKDLLKVTLEMFSHRECSDIYESSNMGILEETQICAGSHNDSSDTCQGDSGGPLQILSSTVDCSYEIIGVTSYGKRCGTVNTPGVYVRVSAFIKWIEDTVWPDL